MSEKLKIEYTRCEAGWIDFTVKYDKTILNYTFSCVFDDPKYFIEWAEKIFQEKFSEYSSDAEGWSWYFDYDGMYLTISDSKNIDCEKKQRIKLKIEKNALCKEIYNSLKRFKSSGLYNPKEWECINFKNLLEKVYGTLDFAIDKLSEFSIEQIIDDIDSKYIDLFGYKYLSFFEDVEFDVSTKEKRKIIIKEYIEDSDYVGYGGDSILDICSDILERL